MFKMYKKIILIFLLIIFCVQTLYADSLYRKVIDEHTDYVKSLASESYTKFLKSINDTVNYNDNVNLFCNMNKDNKYLIVGASGVVYLGLNLNKILDSYSIDVIGFGGVPDSVLLEWVPFIHKKYDKIIIFAGINTVNLCMKAGFENAIPEATQDIKTVYDAYSTLLNKNGKIMYCDIMPYRDKDLTNETSIRYNDLVKALRPNLIAQNIQLCKFDYQQDKTIHELDNDKMFIQLIRLLN